MTPEAPSSTGTGWSLGPLAVARRGVADHANAVLLFVVVATAAVLRIAFFGRAPVFIGGDTSQYYVAAAALLDGQGFPLPLKRPPLYPFFITLVGWGLGEDLRHLVLVQHVLGVGTAALTYGIGRLTFGRGVGFLSGLAAALAGGLLIYEHYVLTEALFAFLLALAVFLFLVGLRRDAPRWLLAAGLATGLATLTRPHAFVLLALGPLVAAVCGGWRPAARAAVLAGGAAALVIVPWAARNKLVHDTWAVVGATGQNLVYKTANLRHGQFVFYDSANPPRDGDPKLVQAARLIQRRADDKAARPEVNIQNREIHARIMRDLKVGEAEADALMRDVALDAIRARPWTYARLALDDLWQIFVGVPDRLSYHWALRERSSGPPGLGLSNLAGPVTPEQRRGLPLTERLVNLYQSPWIGPALAVLFVVGLVGALVRRAWRLALLPGLVVLGLHVIGAAVVGFVARFHHPPDPLLHVLAFGGLLSIGRLVAPWAARLRGLAAKPALPLERARSTPR